MKIMETNKDNENLSIDKEIIYFFKKPSVIFSDFIEKPRYFLMMCVITAINVVYAIMQTSLSMDIVKKSVTGSMPDASKQIAEKMLKYTMSAPVQTVITIVTTVVSIYVVSLIYKIFIRIFGSKIKYKQSMALYCLGSMPLVIDKILKWIYMAVTGKAVGVSSLVKPTAINKFLNSFDIFNIWQIALLIIGISVITKISKKKSAAIVLILFAINLVVTLHSYL